MCICSKLKAVSMVLYWCYLLLLQVLLFPFSGGVVTLTSRVQSAICPGEEVTLTCIVTGGVILEWSSPVFNPTQIRYVDTVGRVRERGIFTATLISRVPSQTPSLFDFTSTLSVNVTQESMLNGTVITCSDQLSPMSTTLTLAAPPSPPVNVTPSIQQYGRNNVSILLQWGPPVNSGETSVDNYTIIVTGTTKQELIIQGTTATITVVYNEMHTINIRTNNCAGSSSDNTTVNILVAGCGEPSSPDNSSFVQFESAEVGAMITYQCSAGFIPRALQVSVCAENRTWTPDPAQLLCQKPPPDRYSDRSILPAGRMRANCTSDGITVDGTWTPDPAILMCNASTVDCGDPNNVTSEVIVQYNSTVVSSVIFYQCPQSGFAPSSSSAVCMESGRWSPDPSQVVCRMVSTMPTVDCGPPETPQNGSLESYTNTTEGSVVFYSCDLGLVPEQWMRAMCTENGWNPNPAELNCFTGSICGSCSTSVAVAAVVSCAVSLIIGAVIGAVVHYCAVRKKSKCQKFYSLTISHKQQKQQPAPVYEDIIAQKETVDPTHIELRENIAYGPV